MSNEKPIWHWRAEYDFAYENVEWLIMVDLPWCWFNFMFQEENPSRESTIVRTAGKLTPFHFNRIPEVDDCNIQLASQRRQKKYNLKPNESLPPESFCRICNSPLQKFDVKSCKLENGKMPAEVIRDRCCTSCQFQILPKDSSTMEHFYSLLPQQMVARAEYSSLGEARCLRWEIIYFHHQKWLFFRIHKINCWRLLYPDLMCYRLVYDP